jgi:hypothetical protein
MILSGTEGGFFPSWTTATRPASPAVGQMGYNTTTGNFDQYTAGGWVTTINSSTGKVLTSQMPTGSVIQMVTANTQTATSTTGAITDTTLTATITPSSSSSKILVLIQGRAYNNTQNTESNWYIYRGATNVFNGRTLYTSAGGGLAAYQTLNYLDSPATTSATTYKLSISTSGGTFFFMVDGATAGTGVITLLEIAG